MSELPTTPAPKPAPLRDELRMRPGDFKVMVRLFKRYCDHDIWQDDDDAPALGLQRLWRRPLRLLVLVAQGLRGDQVLLRASALTYFALLSLVPVLAIAASLMGSFGDTDRLVDFVVANLTPDNPKARETLEGLLAAVDFRALGGIGAGILFVSTVLGLSSVEHAFNRIWGVERQRSWGRRFPDYLATLVIAPLLLSVGAASGAAVQSVPWLAKLLEQPGFSELFRWSVQSAPTAIMFLGFAFLYWFVPNTKVRPGSALIGAAVATTLFVLTRGVYVDFSIGATRAHALYGSLAALSIFIVFLYACWVIVLLGVEFCFAHQNVDTFRVARQGEDPDPGDRESIGLAVAVGIARDFGSASTGVRAEELARSLDVPVRSVREVIGDLREAGIVAHRGDPGEGLFQLGRAAESAPVSEVLRALRGTSQFEAPAAERGLREVLEALRASVSGAIGTRTLADLANAGRSGDGRKS
jgi:membrane protein